MTTYTSSGTDLVTVTVSGNRNGIKIDGPPGQRVLTVDLRAGYPDCEVVVDVDGTPTTYTLADTDHLEFALVADASGVEMEDRADGSFRFKVDLTKVDATVVATDLEADVVLNNTVAATYSGTLQVGETLTRTAGTWVGNNVTLAGQWFEADDGDGLNAAAISGETAATYVIGAPLEGKYIAYRETATESGSSNPGTESVFTDYDGPVIAA